MDKIIYLDNAATTQPLNGCARDAYEFYQENYFNPSANYRNAITVRDKINESRAIIADLIGANAGEIYFTSCATESNNTVFECGVKNKKGNIVVSSMEHASVYECAMRLYNRGYDVRFARISQYGVVEIDSLEQLIDENTTLVSVIHASNETGSLNDIKAVSEIVKRKSPKAYFHSDGVQAFGKFNINLHDLGVDFYSVSSHKIGGFKGTGLLYIKDGIHIKPFLAGGGQEKGIRSGTENVLGIIDFALAARAYSVSAGIFDTSSVRKIFVDRFSKDWIKINSLDAPNNGYIVSLSFKGIKGEILSHVLEDRGIIVGLGSACSSHAHNHRMFDEMGIPKEFSDGSIRVSVNPFMDIEDIVYAADVILEEAEKLRIRING